MYTREREREREMYKREPEGARLSRCFTVLRWQHLDKGIHRLGILPRLSG
jgi:hypothetical protein